MTKAAKEDRRPLPIPADWGLLITSLAILLVVGGVWGLRLRKNPSAYDLSARTEVVRLVTGCRTQPRWVLERATLSIDGEEVHDFHGQIEIGPRSEVRIERIGNGPLRVDLRRDNSAETSCPDVDGRDLAIVVSSEEQVKNGEALDDPAERSVHRDLVLETEGPDAFGTFPFMAWAEVGLSIKSGTRARTPMLTSGTVTFLQQPTFARRGALPYQAGSATLSPGDHFLIDEQTDPGYGFLRIDDDPGMLVGYRASGSEAKVERFGRRLYSLSPTPLESLLNDGSAQAILMTFTAFTALVSALKSFRAKEPRHRAKFPDSIDTATVPPLPIPAAITPQVAEKDQNTTV